MLRNANQPQFLYYLQCESRNRRCQTGRGQFVSASNIDPLVVGNEHYLYIWNSTEVWLYRLNGKGAPNPQPAQHLSFNLAYPAHSFVVNPDGRFAYAAVLWTDSGGNSDAAITLFTIDPSSGELTDTQKVVATYSNFYTYLTGFSFGPKGNLLFARTSTMDPTPVFRTLLLPSR